MNLRLLLFSATLLSLASPLRTEGQQLSNAEYVSAGSLPRLPLVFEPNMGQAGSEPRFLSRGNGYTVLLEPTRTILAFPPDSHGATSRGEHVAEAVTVTFLGATKTAEVTGLEQLPGKSNYYVGKQPDKWLTGIPQFAKVAIESVYPGIDLVYYGNGESLEYDFILSPKADPKLIDIVVAGVHEFHVSESGNLFFRTDLRTFELGKPIVYQKVNGSRKFIPAEFVRRGSDGLGIAVGDYDRTVPLVIDPVLSYSTLIGANNNTTAQGVAVDSTGNVYVTGTTSATNYPTVAPFQSTNKGTTNVFVTKLSPTGNVILYSTYLGGSGFPGASAIAVDSSGSAYVTGVASAPDFPTTPGAFMTTCPVLCNTPFVAKFLTNGTLAYSTFMGGSNSPPHAIAVDSAGEAYIAGDTASNDLPTTPGSFEPNYPGLLCTSCNNGYVEKLNASGTALVYSTYFGQPGFGGVPSTNGTGIAVDSAGSAYLVGTTNSITTLNPIEPGPASAFLTKFTADGSALVYSTYLAGSGTDTPVAVAVDSTGNAHVAGYSTSCDFPLLVNAFSTTCVTGSNQWKVFALAVNANGSQLLFSTFLGDGFATGVAVDKNGNTYVSGTTATNYFPMVKPIEAGSQNTAFNAFVTQLNPSGQPLFSTYLGSQGNTQSSGVAVDGKGAIYLAGTGNGDFPLLHPIPSQVKMNTNYQIFIAKILPNGAGPRFSLSPRRSPILSLRNMSTAPLNISSITSSSNFTQGGTCGNSLAPASGCTLVLEGAADNKTSGTVTITSNAYSTPQTFVISKSPSGDTVGPLVTILPNTLQFPVQFVGTSSAVQQITITNVGLQGSVLGNFGTSGDFSQTNNCPALLNPGSSCTILVVYSPSAAGNGFAEMAFTHDQFQENLPVFGIGSASAIHASTSAVQFGTQFVGSSPLARILNLTNTTPYFASVTGLATSSGFGQVNTCTAPLPPHTDCRVAVTYSPSTNEYASGTLTASNFGPGGAQVVNLYATGMIPGDLGVSPLALSIPAQVGSTGGPQSITLTNNSQKTVSITSIQTAAPFSQTNNCPASLGPTGSCQIAASFTPAQPGTASGTLQIAYAGTGSPQVVSLSGTAQTKVQFSPTPVVFGQQQVTVASPINYVFVENLGSTTVTLKSITVQGTDYSLAQNNCPKTLAPNVGCSVGLVFTPSITGPRAGTLTVLASDYSQPHVDQLQGTGIGTGQVSLSVASLSFGPQAIGTTSPAQVVTLSNTGSGALGIAGISSSPGFFQVSSTCGKSLAAGASCTFSVRFSPTLAGILAGTLTISDDSAGGPHSIPLSGIGQ